MTPSERAPGLWRVAARGAPVFLAAIVVYALVQYALVAPGLTPAVDPRFLVLVAIAYLLDVALAAVCAAQASAGARGLSLTAAFPRGRRARRIAEVLGWSALGVVVVSFTALISAIAAAVILLVGAAVTPAIVAGRGFRAWLRPLRWAPVRTVVWGVLSYLGLVACAFADAESGFLLGGPVGAAVARIVTGVIGVLTLCGAAVVAERAQARWRVRGGARDPVSASRVGVSAAPVARTD